MNADIQVLRGEPYPYWERPIPDAFDVQCRLDSILKRAGNMKGNLSVSGAAGLNISDITKLSKITSNLQLAVADLDKTTAGATDGSSLFSYVTHSFTRKYPSKDLLSSITRCEKNFSIFLAYPVSAKDSGQNAEIVLDEIGRIVEAGFTAWSIHRSYPARVMSPEKVDVSNNWLIIEVQVTVPYNTGYMDNQDFVRQSKGESFKIRMTLDIEGDGADSDDVTLTSPAFGNETALFYTLETGSRTPDAPNQNTAFGENPVWFLEAPTEAGTLWSSTITFSRFFLRDSETGEVRYDDDGMILTRLEFVSATAPVEVNS